MITLAFALLASPWAGAQVLYGTITGTITDKSGAVVPNVTVNLINQATGETRTATSNATGQYAMRDILPGPYSLSIKKNGSFSGYSQRNLAVEANHEIRMDVVLQLASVVTEVTVDTAPPPLQTETAEVNNDLSPTELKELPLYTSEGRNFQSLYTIIPGSTNVSEQNSTGGNPFRAMSVNMNGMEDMGNITRIDGAVNVYGWLPYLIAYVPPADAIDSVNVVTNSFNAEQGVAGGASTNVIVKSGTQKFHGSVWEYYQDAAFNARAYTSTKAALTSALNPTGAVPKNVFNQLGFTVGGPVYIPKILTGKKKLFFFQDWERTSQAKSNSGQQTVPDTLMASGDFSEVASGLSAGNTILYDPQPGGTGPYLPVGSRPTFLSEYGCNCIPASRQSKAAQLMLARLAPISKAIGTPTTAQLAAQLQNDYTGTTPFAYIRDTEDTKITWIPSDNTQIFGRYSEAPYTANDPQALGAAGGGTFDGGQPGAAQGVIRNVGLGMTHIFSPTLVLDADGGYTRQRTGAVDPLDQSVKTYGVSVLGIPGTNGTGTNVNNADYYGLPQFAFGTAVTGSSSTFSAIGNSNGANPFLFRDNQFTADVNLSWTKGKHATKYGVTYYHFDLNHFQPSGGGGVLNPRGAFQFQGGMTANQTSGITAYNSLADFLLGLPNSDPTKIASIGKLQQLYDPNTLRWSQYGGYAQDQWTMSQKMTVNFGVRYDFFPLAYKDHEGLAIMDPSLPQSANVILGGLGGNSKNPISAGWGMFEPRLGLVYRMTEKLVIRSGGGITEDADSQRFMRDSYPSSQSASYSSSQVGTIATDNNGNPLPLTVGIPVLPEVNFSTGFASLPVSGGTTTMPKKYRRGYVESWNLAVQQELRWGFVANIAYVGTHQVRQLAGIALNTSALPDSTTPCMANGYWNPSTGLTGTCKFTANYFINQKWCAGTSNLSCYSTAAPANGAIIAEPIFSSNYNGMQNQLTRNGKNESIGVVYTWSHAFDYEDNGAGSGSAGTAWSSPAYLKYNRASSGYDRTHNLQIWDIYQLPFGKGQAHLNQGLAALILGGFQVNGQLSHVSGAPFSVTASNSDNLQGGQTYANLVAPYKQLGGHNRTPGNTTVSGGNSWFDPKVFANPVEPTEPTGNSTSGVLPMVLGNTHRNQFRGPGVTVINASAVKAFSVYRETKFELRAEAVNLLNHAQLNNPNTTVNGGTFGYITSFGPSYQTGSRTLQFSGRYTF
jgi:hypothetical protein